MNQKVLQKLEFHKIIKTLADLASSELGKQYCSELVPIIDLEEINLMQLETSDALSRLFKKGSTSFSGNKNVASFIRSLEVSSILSASELLKIAGLLECTNRVKSYGRSEKQEETMEDSLFPYFEELQPLTILSNEIRRCILSEEEISDDASSTLKNIRRSMRLTNEKIHSQLSKMVNGSVRTYLQDAVITMRNNRYCIPVKAEYKGQVSGMIHDQSQTGATLFIEPTAIVNLNNQLKELAMEEQDEIEVILSTLSLEATEYTEEIRDNQRILTKLDFIFAKGSLALSQNATKPLFNRKHRINIRKGRHPLLDKKTVVPIDVHLGREFDQLIVTGPNTGGKTVSIKTVGLFTLMGQAGLHIPALDRSELGIFTEVYADIGDEQSIEQSLSTFSSHMTNIVSILKTANHQSLCLFDELGAGTDPTEGAALAISILTFLHKRNIHTMATTHYSELKIFALTTDHVENACCEFNVETLRPTYRLLIGIPGKSNAFAISSKLGLTDEIIDFAKKQITEENESFEDLLTDLEQNRTTIENERLELALYKEKILTLEKQLRNKKEKMALSKERILRDANEEAREILQDAKKIADETIRSLQKHGSPNMKDLEQTRQGLRNHINDKNSKLSLTNNTPKVQALKSSQLKLGDSVKIISMGLKGSVSSLPDARGKLYVQCGIIRSLVNVNDLTLLFDDDISSKIAVKSKNRSVNLSKASSISMEINLLGQTVDEALANLDKYLDDAYLSHLPSVRIVHGKGTGALRKAVQGKLKTSSYISNYRLGEAGEGDTGVTIAVFK